MSGSMLADERGSIPHSNVVMVTMEPYGHVDEITKVSLSVLEKCAQ